VEDVLGWGALGIALLLLVLGIQVLGHGGQALLVKTEFIAYGLTDFGITNPTVAWLVLGALVGGAAGFAIGFGRAGRKVEMAFASVTVPALLVLLSVLSSSAPKPALIAPLNNKADQQSQSHAGVLSRAQPSKLPRKALPRPLSTPLAEAMKAKPIEKVTKSVTTVVLSSGSETKTVKIGETFVRSVRVDRHRGPEQALNLVGWSLDTDECNGYTMPEVDAEEVEIVFFKLPRKVFVSLEELETVYETMGLKPDPYALAALNQEDRSLSEKYPNMVQWKAQIEDPLRIKHGLDVIQNKNGVFHHLKFRTLHGKTGPDRNQVYCGDFTLGWAYKYDGVEWWYAGVRK
jgi:hypothetical protein